MSIGVALIRDRIRASQSGALPAPRSRRHLRLLAVGAALLTCAPFLSMLPAAVAGAGSQAISMVTVAAAPQVLFGDRALGAVAASSKQTGVVVLKPSDPSALTSFIVGVTDKSSPLFHHYLAPGAFSGLEWLYRPLRCLLKLTAARASRSASRRFSVSRLSQSCLPLARANSHFTRPLRK